MEMLTFKEIVNDIVTPQVTMAGSIFKLLLSMVLGSVVGYERRRRGQTAGVRTFSLIAMGATLAMLLSIYVPQEYMGLKNGDPGRIAAQVVTGIGFLGAGAIIQMKGSVRGLTTAAGIWMVATIGMAVGVGMYVISIVATLLILFILVQLEKIENRLSTGAENRIIRVCVSEIIDDVEPYRAELAKYDITLNSYYLEYDYTAGSTRLSLVILARKRVDYPRVFAVLRTFHATSSISLASQL